MPFVSLIIPIYNAEKYLRRCLNSVMQQTYPDMETILVNDGSENASLEICREYEAMDNRFRIIVDGAVFTEKQHIRERGLLTREAYAEYMMQDPADFYYGVLWNKLFRRSIIAEHRLEMNADLRWCEDFLFNLTVAIAKDGGVAVPMSRRRKKLRAQEYIEDELPPGYSRVSHGFEPVYDGHSRVLILGSFPSVKSRENSFYYGHPQNRFWKLMARLLDEDTPKSIEDKKSLLLRHGIAVWDVVAVCDIKGSSDSSIRNVIPADINRVLRSADVRTIIANGNTAYRLYQKYCREQTGRDAVRCPSTSPANAIFTLDRLAEVWGEYIM